MNQALPAGLINPSVSDLDQASEDDVRLTNSEELHRFWKVYEAQNDYSSDPSNSRLRNLFWRIWSSDRLAGSISNEQLNLLWLRCRRTDPIKPFHLPRGFYQRYGNAVTQRSSRQDDRRTSLGSMTEAPSTTDGTQQPSLTLKYPPTGWACSGTATTDVSSARSERTETGRGESNTTSTGSSASSSRPTLRRNASGSKGRVPVVAASSRGRAKPALVRRKSSQGQTAQIVPARQPQPVLRSPTTTAEGGQDLSPQSTSILGAQEPALALPLASSWQSVEETSPRDTSPIVTRPESQTGSLVDRNFRSKFLSSATNLPALARTRKTGSVVRFADEAENADTGKERVVSPPASPEKARPRQASQVIDSDDSEELDRMQLPRTQSQLSMAIQDRRKKSGSRDLGPEPAVQQEVAKKNDTKRKEEELLNMGRRAAAPRIPKGRGGSGEERGYRSPSPGPTF